MGVDEVASERRRPTTVKTHRTLQHGKPSLWHVTAVRWAIRCEETRIESDGWTARSYGWMGPHTTISLHRSPSPNRPRKEETAAVTKRAVATSASCAAPTARGASPKTRRSSASRCATWSRAQPCVTLARRACILVRFPWVSEGLYSSLVDRICHPQVVHQNCVLRLVRDSFAW